MRTLTLIGLLALTTACEDRQIEVREAATENSSTEHSTEATENGSPGTGPGSEEAGEHGDEAEEVQAELTLELLERGNGPAIHTHSTVRVHYEAWLAEAHTADEAPFDSSLSRLVPLELQLGGAGPGVIEGLTRGLLGLHEGSRALIHIPARLGWGAEGNPAAGIAPDSDLVYEVRVVSVR